MRLPQGMGSVARRFGFGDVALRVLQKIAAQPYVAKRIFRRIVTSPGADKGPGDGHHDDLMDFLAYAQVHRREAFGQLLQDLWVLYETGSKVGGYFVEFGAADGVAHSNTLLLEREFGWAGLLAEPNPAQEAALRRNRAADIDMRCVWGLSGESVELLVTADPELSTVVAAAGEDEHTETRLLTGVPVRVETVSLNDLLTEHLSPHVIDYLSIDTEGTELAILEGFDFATRDIRLISVEHNHRPENERLLDAIMTRHGYQRRFRELSDFDAWFRKI